MEAAKALAVVIRVMRREKGLSQDDLNTIDLSYLGRIERGEVNITIDILIRLATILELDAAVLILMATSLQSQEPFTDALKRLTKQLNRIKKDGIDLQMEALSSAGKLRPGRPARTGAAQKAAEAVRMKNAGVSIAEIGSALELSATTVRRYLKTPPSS
ncbi:MULTISPECIES: transcriptional regulator [Pseudomonas]|uniref:transcriptional regulator n=1 Tax=Pseudomonas TaxID=286 RepID=UPI00283A909C|nr:transcriptional regulator [Pseudomonas sputi]